MMLHRCTLSLITRTLSSRLPTTHIPLSSSSSSSSSLSSSSSSSSSSCSSSSSSFSPPCRHLSTGRPLLGLEDFFMNQRAVNVGRPWSVHEIRLKSFEDIRKLWFVLLKERNMLYTYKHQCKYLGESMVNPARIRKVKESMKAIKVVLNERYREFKQNTDPTWVALRHRLLSYRRSYNARIKARTGLPSHKRDRSVAIKGMPAFRLNKMQKYQALKPRKEGQMPPEGNFPAGMTFKQSGHGQLPQNILTKQPKQDPEYF